MDLSNEGRAERASRALNEYGAWTMDGDIRTAMIDLMTDALHLAGEEGLRLDFSSLATIAYDHYDWESKGNE